MLFALSTTRVTNSRFFKRQNTVWRRRQTPDGVVFTTRETIDYDQITVIKSDQTEVKYKPGKLYLSLLRACDHMEEPEDVAWHIKTTIEEKFIVRLNEKLHIRTLDLAEIAIDTLKLFDTSAYVKFASHHPDIVSARKLAASLR